jgi:DNA replication ATP-dependent helicase/nuclease Dna2
LYERKTSHLTARHAEFFKHWESLIALEEQDMNRFRKELWTMTASAREKTGRSFAAMVIVHHMPLPEHKIDYSNSNRRHVYTFERFSSGVIADKSKGKSLLTGYITKGDAVVISVEPYLLALSRGFIVELEPTRVIIALDRELTSRVTTRNQSAGSLKPGTKQNILFRIDKDELSTGLGRIRDNLAQLFYAKGDVKRLSLIVDLDAPYFDDILTPTEEELPVHLNVNQKAAMKKVLAARDYALILGMPGTGKTTTIAEIIKTLVANGKTVLLTSYTHSAVDTILMKLLETDIDVLRLGPADKVGRLACPFATI